MASRGISCSLNSEPIDFSNVKACSPDDGDDIYEQADAAEQQRKWLFAFIHSLDGGRDCWGSWEIDMWTTYLDYLKGKNLWVGTFGAAVKYIQERAAATLSVVSSSSDRIVLNLSDTLDDAVYSQPLTIRSDVPAGWVTANVQQGSSNTVVKPVVEGTATVIYYNAVPDRGFITLRNPQSGNPQISAIVPQYVTAGSPAFTLTVNGSNFVSSAKARWNGVDRTTTFVSATQLRASILAADIAAAGMIPVTVLNPDGGLSNAMTFEVRVPAAAYTDDFNPPNESPLKGGWSAWDFGLGSLELYNNQIRSTDTNPYNVWARRTSEPYNSANHYSQIKLTSTPSREVGGPGVRVQLNGSEINGYIFTLLNSTTAAIWVRYGTSGTWQQVGTNFTGTFASGDIYKLAISGNALTAYRNGTSLGTRTDTSNRVPSGTMRLFATTFIPNERLFRLPHTATFAKPDEAVKNPGNQPPNPDTCTLKSGTFMYHFFKRRARWTGSPPANSTPPPPA